VLEYNVEDLRVARVLTKGLLDRGITPDRILALVNRYERRGAMIGWSEVVEVLSRVRVERLPNDDRPAAKAINYGKPLAQVAPRSRLRREIQRLAGLVGRPTTNGELPRTR
jgi:Flp pilus assembly CpaE family ATPase